MFCTSVTNVNSERKNDHAYWRLKILAFLGWTTTMLEEGKHKHTENTHRLKERERNKVRDCDMGRKNNSRWTENIIPPGSFDRFHVYCVRSSFFFFVSLSFSSQAIVIYKRKKWSLEIIWMWKKDNFWKTFTTFLVQRTKCFIVN